MEFFWYRGQKCKACSKPIPIFGLGHYFSKEECSDEFSKKIAYFHKYGSKEQGEYFLQRIIEFYESRIKGDLFFDIICVCPSHKKGEFNPHMFLLAKKFSEITTIPFRNIIQRKRDVNFQHELNMNERENNVKDSYELTEEIKNKNILAIDNTSITGKTALEIHKQIVHIGQAKNCVFLCFGLGAKGKDGDFDINPTFKGKVSAIVSNWHWPKVPKEKRISK